MFYARIQICHPPHDYGIMLSIQQKIYNLQKHQICTSCSSLCTTHKFPLDTLLLLPQNHSYGLITTMAKCNNPYTSQRRSKFFFALSLIGA
jgi:hypothetical protein